VQEQQYAELFDRYVQHVSVWVKKERVYNRVTQRYEEPDEKMMVEVERLLDVKGESVDWRRQLISGIAAWALDHPGQKVDPSAVFPQHLRRMREAIFADRRPAVAQLARWVVILVRDEGQGLEADQRRDADATIERMIARFGYCRECAADSASLLVRKRFNDLV
jgi:predicted Ser/Thr protein kinase